jgi:four helix bundle protein
VNTPSPDKPWDIRERTFAFSVRVVKLCRKLEREHRVERALIGQLLRATTSIGANAEEAQAGQSRADFISKNAICLKEARETHYWLRLFLAADIAAGAELTALQQEAGELMKIFGAIVASAKRTQPA